MNEQLIKKVQDFKATVIQTWDGGQFFEAFGRNSSLVIQVRDPVYCRVFDLETFYEFDDAHTIDIENIDMTVQLLVKNPEGIVTNTLMAFRVASQPGAYGVFNLLNPYADIRILEGGLTILSDFLLNLKAHTVIVTGLREVRGALDLYKKEKYTVLDSYTDPSLGESVYLLYKKL